MKKILEKNFHFIIFLVFFILQTFIYSDYGFSWDETFSRLNGLVSFNYIVQKLSIFEYFSLKDIPDLENYIDNEYGVFFEILNIFIEKIFNLNDKEVIYRSRHYFNSLIFFIASIYFYFTLNKFYPKTISLFGFLIFLTHPRIFAQSFYNSKDIIFLCFFCFSSYYLISFIIHKKIKTLIILTLFIGITIGTRVMGLMIPLLFIFFHLMENLEKSRHIKLYLLIPFLILSLFFTILFWPYLWENPYNIITAFKSMSNYAWNGLVYFESKYYSGQFLPWYYLPKIIIITSPLLHLILFFLGLSLISKKLFSNLIKINDNKDNIWTNYEELFSSYSILIIFLTLIIVIELNSTLYNDWRQIYYIYPSIIFIAIYGLNKLQEIIKYKKIFLGLVFILLVDNVLWIYKNHPYQYVFYNSFIKKENIRNYELDYWGVSNLDILKTLPLIQSSNEYKIFIFSSSPYEKSLNMIPKKDHYKYKFVDKIENAEFILTNHFYQNKDPKIMEKFLNSNYDLIYEIRSNNVRINSIYKKR